MKLSELENLNDTFDKVKLISKNTNMCKDRKPGDLAPLGLALLYRITEPSVWNNITQDWQPSVIIPEFSYEPGDNDDCKIMELNIKTPTDIHNGIDMVMINNETTVLGFELAIQLVKFNYKSIILHDIEVMAKEINLSDSVENYHSIFNIKLYFDAE